MPAEKQVQSFSRLTNGFVDQYDLRALLDENNV
jgi:hypothetical protein